MGLELRQKWTGGYLLTSGALKAEERFGRGTAPGGEFRLDDADGTVFAVDFSLATETAQTWDLKGGGGERDAINAALAFVTVHLVYIQLDTPAAGTSVRFGPQDVADACPLWFPGVGATAYDTVRGKLIMDDPVTGWAVGASTKKVTLYNPGAATVTGKLRIAGTK